MDLIILPLAAMGHVFLLYPFMALIPAGIFAWWYRRSGALTNLLAALLWLVYTIYEYGMYLRILCTGECNIRIDLLLIYPLLLVISLTAIISFMLKRKLPGG
jgi:hypothetical protein